MKGWGGERRGVNDRGRKGTPPYAGSYLRDVWLISDGDEGVKEGHDGGGGHYLRIHKVG